MLKIIVSIWHLAGLSPAQLPTQLFYVTPIWQFQILLVPWWRHQMEKLSALLAICVGNSRVPGEFPAQRPVTRSFDVFFDLHPSKQWWGWWFETPSCPLWRHGNVEFVGLHRHPLSHHTTFAYSQTVKSICRYSTELIWTQPTHTVTIDKKIHINVGYTSMCT